MEEKNPEKFPAALCWGWEEKTLNPQPDALKRRAENPVGILGVPFMEKQEDFFTKQLRFFGAVFFFEIFWRDSTCSLEA